jgi:hypothetical protein
MNNKTFGRTLALFLVCASIGCLDSWVAILAIAAVIFFGSLLELF